MSSGAEKSSITPPASPAPLSEATYSAMFAGADQGFCLLQLIFDDQNRPIDYLYLDVNDAFEQHTGIKGALGKTIRELVPDLDEAWFRLYGGVALTGKPYVLKTTPPP